nr:MAG TPA: major capsid protein [Caudoviricetes sp.]
MAITLAEAKVGMANKVDQQVVDEFRRSSLLLDNLIFDNAISPGTGGSTLTYGYIQLSSPRTAGTRAINSEYTAAEAKRTEKTAKAIVMGGSFQIDRVIQDTSGAINELNFQMEQAIKATSNYFHNLVINGTSASSGTGYVTSTFDGLKALASASGGNKTSATVSLAGESETASNYQAFLDEVDAWLSTMDGRPTMLLMNTKMLNKIRSCARRAGYYDRTKDDFGRYVESYNGIPLMDAGYYYNGTATEEIIKTTAASASAAGTTDMYAVNIALDGFHGIAPTGSRVINTYLPDFSEPGAVKKGEVELVAGVVAKNTKKIAMLSGIPIVAKTA